MEEEFAHQREEQERFYSNNVGFAHDFAVSMMENCEPIAQHSSGYALNYDLSNLNN